MMIIFNPTAATANYTVNNSRLFTVRGWTTRDAEATDFRAAKHYVPQSIVAGLGRHRSEGCFGLKECNTFEVNLSYRSASENVQKAYNIDLSHTEISIDKNYIIYAFRDRIWLLKEDGYWVENSVINPNGSDC